MRLTTFFLIFFTLISCKSSYENEELKAIEDISNEFLKENDLNIILNPPPSPNGNPSWVPNLDSLDIKVVFSDELVSINDYKKSDTSMFKNNDFTKADSIIFNQIINSKKFEELEKKSFNKNNLKLAKPYRQVEKKEIKLEEGFPSMKFSRICFDKKMQNGVVVIDYSNDVKTDESSQIVSSASGFNGALLIRKVNNKWAIVNK